MEQIENKPRDKYEWKNVYVGSNPDTGRRYFEKRKVLIPDPNQPPDFPPDKDLLTREELDKKKSEKMKKDWIENTSKDGRPPIGGAQND